MANSDVENTITVEVNAEKVKNLLCQQLELLAQQKDPCLEISRGMVEISDILLRIV